MNQFEINIFLNDLKLVYQELANDFKKDFEYNFGRFPTEQETEKYMEENFPEIN